MAFAQKQIKNCLKNNYTLRTRLPNGHVISKKKRLKVLLNYQNPKKHFEKNFFEVTMPNLENVTLVLML